MRKISVKNLKMLEALQLDVTVASDEELASALLILEILNKKAQKAYSLCNNEFMSRKERQRQISMFEDEEFFNAVNSVTLSEETTTLYNVDREAVLKDYGVSDKSTKVGDFIECRPVFKEQKFVEAFKAGTLSSSDASHVSFTEIKQVCMKFGNGLNKEDK